MTGEKDAFLPLTIALALNCDVSADLNLNVVRRYAASVDIMAYDAAGSLHNLTIGVKAAVKAVTVARRSLWGGLPEGQTCSSQFPGVRYKTLYVGLAERLPFSACDVEGLPVSHQLPTEEDDRAFRVTLKHRYSSDTDIMMNVEYMGGSLYEVGQ